MALKTHYERLGIPQAATADQVKQAFRRQVARYHPDKVQHLGREFQEMAATRTAELTEAYFVLSNDTRRVEYDARLAADVANDDWLLAGSARPLSQSSPIDPSPPLEVPGAQLFRRERATRDEFVRKAALDRFRQAFGAVAEGAYSDAVVRGFDAGWVPKQKLFGRKSGPRMLTRFVARVDAPSVADAWIQAARWNVPPGEEICVILMGTVVAPARELADAIAELRRRPVRGGKVTMIPLNASAWDAHLPIDAPSLARDLLARLRRG